MKKVTGLLDSYEIKGLTFKNRIVMPPMQTGLATEKGEVTDNLLKYYKQRARSVGLLIVEHSYISKEGMLSKNQLGVYNDCLINGLSNISKICHSFDTPSVLQINHAGRSANKENSGFQPVSPSPSNIARELTKIEIGVLAETFGKAAKRAILAGFDGIEIHGAHGFLLNQFYSPLVNKRKDCYGGNLRNRMRFPLEVVKKVKENINDKLLLYRLGSVDLEDQGIQIEDSIEFSKELKKTGIDVIDVSGGMCGSRPAQLQDIKGYFVEQATEIKKKVNIPVIGVGGIREAEYANSLIKKGKIDLVAVGRPLYKKHDWVNRAIKEMLG